MTRNDTRIILHLTTIAELLRTPVSVYKKRLLRADAETFIVEEAEGMQAGDRIGITVYLPTHQADCIVKIPSAIHQHFRYRREQEQKKLRRIIRNGWRSLFIALLLLAVIFTITEFVLFLMPGSKIMLFIGESFVILGWVVLWRPLEILLYDRYPSGTRIKLLKRLEEADVNSVVTKELQTLDDLNAS